MFLQASPDIDFANIFLQSVACLHFHVFQRAEVLNFSEVSLKVFF